MPPPRIAQRSGSVPMRHGKMRALDEVLTSLSNAEVIRRADVAALITHMNASSLAHALSLYTSRSTAPTNAGVGWHVHHEDPIDAASVRTAKLVVNAVLSALQVKRSATTTTKFSPQDVLPWLDAFRISMCVLVSSNMDVLTLAPVALSVIRRLADVHMDDYALTELVALRTCIDPSSFTLSATRSVHEPGSAAERLRACMSYACEAPSSAYTTLVLDAYACALQVAPAVASFLHTLVDVWPSLAEWNEYGRAQGLDAACDRTAYMAERATSKMSQTLQRKPDKHQDDPSLTVEALTLRMAALELIMPAASLDPDAVWDRAGRLGALHGLEASYNALVQVYESAQAHQMACGTSFERVITWWTRAAHALGRCDLAPPASSSIPQISDGVSDAEAWSACLAALASPADGSTSIPAELMTLPSTPVPPSFVSSLSSQLRTALRNEGPSPTFLIRALHIVRHVPATEGLAMEAVHAACLLLKLVFSEHEPASLDACLQGSESAHAVATPPHQHTLATHLFHYGSRLYAVKQYAHASRFVQLACACTEASLPADPDGSWRIALIRQYHVLAGALQHMTQYRPAYTAYMAGVRHAFQAQQNAAEATDLFVRVLRGAHHVSVFALLDPHVLVADVTAIPTATAELRGRAFVSLLDELMPMLQREEAPYAFDTLCAAALDTYDVGTHPVERLRVLLRRSELRILRQEHVDWDDVRSTVDRVADKAPTPVLLEFTLTFYLLATLDCVQMHSYSEALAHVQQARAWHDAHVPAANKSNGQSTRAAVPRRAGSRRNANAAGAAAIAANAAATKTPSRMPSRTPSRPPSRTPSRSLASLPSTPQRREVLDPNDTSHEWTSSMSSLFLLVCDALVYAGLPIAALDILRLAQSEYDAPIIHVRHAEVCIMLGAPDAAWEALCPFEQTSARAMLVHAQIKAILGHVSDAQSLYDAAISEVDVPRCGASAAWERGWDKASLWELQSCAAETCAVVYTASGDASEALHALLHALRIRLRTAMLLAQAAPAAGNVDSQRGEDDDDVFSSSPTRTRSPTRPDHRSAKPSTRRVAISSGTPSADKAGVARAASASTTKAPSTRFSGRGMSSLQWRTSCGILSLYRSVSQMYARRGAVRDADAFARECVDFGDTVSVPWMRASAHAWLAEWTCSCGDTASAAQLAAQAYESNTQVCPSLARVHAAYVLDVVADDGVFERSKQCLHEVEEAAKMRVWHDMHNRITCAQAVRLVDTRSGAARDLVSSLDGCAAHLIRARTYLAEARAAIQSDAVFGMLPDMARSVPSVMPSNRRVSPAIRSAYELLEQARAAAEHVLTNAAVLDVCDVRMALVCAREAVLTSASLGRSSVADEASSGTASALSPAPFMSSAACVVAAMTNAVSSISVRRACADARMRRAMRPKAEWLHRLSASSVVKPWREYDVQAMPTWSDAGAAAAVISLSSDARELIVARYGDAYDPCVFVLPLHRQSYRDAEDDDDVLHVETVMTELRQIIHSSNVGVQGAKDVKALEARKVWWTHRRALDAQLGSLLQLVQDAWFSGLHGLLAPWPSPSAMYCLRDKVESVLARACGSPTRVRLTRALPDASLACLAAMQTYRDEDLEDWLHYALDAYQLGGVPVAQDEVDLDELCVDLRSALDEFHVKYAGFDAQQHHMYLVLDRHLCELPWESLPVLRSQSVTRLTSLDQLPHCVQKNPSEPIPLRTSNTAYLLNPSGDLTRSEERFAPCLQAHSTWHGTIGRAPVLDEVAQALASHDTFLYFGHSGAEMYVHPARLRELSRCAATMLWGCSSGALQVQGVHDPMGTPYHYAVAQCPALLAALWDTTDRELDLVCEAVLQCVGLFADREATSSSEPKRLSLSQALVAARERCKLPYLTGAACVVYGAPVIWV